LRHLRNPASALLRFRKLARLGTTAELRFFDRLYLWESSMVRALAIIAAAAPFAGCDSGDDGSDEYLELSTSQMRLRATVESSDALTANVTVQLSNVALQRDTIYYKVKPTESLTACVGAVCKAIPQISRTEYQIDLPYVAETPYTISFLRPDDVSAVNTFVTLPVPIAILAPDAGSYVTDGQVVIFHWAPATGQSGTAATMEARCEHSNGTTSSRMTQLQFPIRPDAGEAGVWISLQPEPPEPRAERCDVEFSVSRNTAGVVDSALHPFSSSISSRIRRSVIVKWTPLP
jgi:hypothetical protein